MKTETKSMRRLSLPLSLGLRHYALTFLAGSALLAAAAIIGPAPASANPIQPSAAQPNAALPNPALTHATLNINVRDASFIGAPADGAPQSTAGLGANRAGVEFTARQVTHIGGEAVNLLMLRGWELAAGLSAADAIAGTGVTLGAPTVTTTNAQGLATKNLPIGLYLVTETATPAGVVSGFPFLVTLPLTNPVGDGWLHDVWVYPKADDVTINKTVDVAGSYALGDTVTWTLTADIPRGPNPVTGFMIVDPIDARLSVSNVAVSLTGGPVTLIAAHFNTVQADGQVRVQFTPAGLAQLNAANLGATQQVQVVITTQVNSVGTGATGGIIENQAWLFPSTEAIANFTPGANPLVPGNPFPPIVSPTPDTRWGGVDVTKASALTGNGLVASYQVFRTEADARAGVNPVVVPGAALHPNGGSVWTTNAQGQVSIDGLRISEFGVPGTTGAAGNTAHAHAGFWLVEVLAPVGYELLAEPLFFHVNNIVDGVADIQIVNVPANAGFLLPLTGGEGARNFAGAAALIGMAGIGGLVARRRKTATA